MRGVAGRATTRHDDPLGAQAERLGAGAEGPGVFGRTRPVLVVLAAYTAVGAAAAGLTVALGHDQLFGLGPRSQTPWTCDSWLGMRGLAALLSSVGAGVCIGALTIGATRAMVRRAAWARALHSALRPAVHGADDRLLVVVAVASGLGEELLFRGLLVPLVGVVLSSLVFGALHQIRGQARWGWMAWATLMGLLFGAVFEATGSLAGPIVAHAMINAANLRFLRDNDPVPRRRALGGLLRRQPSSQDTP